MEQDGQVLETPDTIDSIADFLADHPAADASGPAKKQGKQQTSEDPEEDQSEELEENEDDPADDEEDTPSEEPEKQTSLKFKVPVKGEDGADTSIEVDEKELIAGYQRHSDYTRKTQELANREREVTQQVATRLQEGQNHYMQQAQLAHAAVRQLAGLKSSEEMAVLAQTDPAQWVQEQQRERAISGVLNQLEAGLQEEQAQIQAMQKQNQKKAFEHAWSVLNEAKIDKPALQKIYTTVSDKYGITPQQLSNLYDPKFVMVMRDAAAYQELKAQKATVTKKAQEAPKLPTARQTPARDEQRAQQLDKRFSSGRAKLSDLAEFLHTNKL